MVDPWEKFRVRCWAGYYGEQWLVVRVADRRIMTSGGIVTCLRWMDVWAPTPMGDKPGTPLAPDLVL